MLPAGDFSDYSAFFCLGVGLASIFKPDVWTMEMGPLRPLLDPPLAGEAGVMIRFSGGMFMFMGLVLFVNRWNKVRRAASTRGEAER